MIVHPHISQSILFHKNCNICIRGLHLRYKYLIFHLIRCHIWCIFPFAVIFGHYTEQRITVQRLNWQISGRRQGEKSNVHNTVFDPVRHIRISSLIQFNINVRITLMKRMDNICHPVCTYAGKTAYFYISHFQSV